MDGVDQPEFRYLTGYFLFAEEIFCPVITQH